MRRQSVHRYPRTVRLNELIREILADELERVDDDRLALVTITAVAVESDLRTATVWFDALDADHDDEIVEAFGEMRPQLQRAVGRQITAKRTPVLSFAPDVAIRSAERIESVLREQAPVLQGRRETLVDESVYRQPRQPDADELDEDDDIDDIDDVDGIDDIGAELLDDLDGDGPA